MAAYPGPAPGPWQCKQLLPPPAAKQQPAWRPAALGHGGLRPCSGLLAPAQGPGRCSAGRKSEPWLPLPARAPFPAPPGWGEGGGAEGSMPSALRNVLWENADAIIPSYFPWLEPRYSAGPLHSQAPALLLSRDTWRCGQHRAPMV